MKKVNVREIICGVSMLLFSFLRIFLGHGIGVWFPAGQVWDDQLMVKYSLLSNHFTVQNHYPLVKDMSFPFLLGALSKTGIPYTIFLSLFWVVAAYFVFFLMKRLFKGNLIVSFLGFLYVLFLPQAFELWSGTRLYRTAIIAPFTIVTFCLLVWAVIYSTQAGARKIISLILLGLCFSFTYYIKEDGMWLMACLIFTTLVCIAHILVNRDIRRSIRTLFLRLFEVTIPILLFVLVTCGYKAINHHFFGVYEINTRTEGEYAKFMANIYKTESDSRSLYCWAPVDAIEKVFKTSPTLASHPELFDAVINTVWYGDDLYHRVIPGDHFAFIFRDALNEAGLYTSEKDVLDFLKRVNFELNEAFSYGALKKQQGVFQLLPSTGGYTLEEVMTLKDSVVKGFSGAILLDGYQYGIMEVTKEEIEANRFITEQAARLTRLDYLLDYSEQLEKTERFRPAFSVLLSIYKVVNVAFLTISCLAVLYVVIRFFIELKSLKTIWQKRYRIVLDAVTTIVFVGIALLYTFSIGWFSAFLFGEGINMLILNFYNIALPTLLFFAYIFGLKTIYDEVVLLRRRDS